MKDEEAGRGESRESKDGSELAVLLTTDFYSYSLVHHLILHPLSCGCCKGCERNL